METHQTANKVAYTFLFHFLSMGYTDQPPIVFYLKHIYLSLLICEQRPHSQPYSMMDTMNDLYNLNKVENETLLLFQVLLSFIIAAVVAMIC